MFVFVLGYKHGMIRLGYVGVNTLLPSASRTFRFANYTEERMLQTTSGNLEALKNILAWNLSHRITLFRITSGLVPFASSPVNSGSWKSTLKERFAETGEFIKKNNFSVSFHPGQYTILNSPVESVYETALRDLEYHTDVIELMGLSNEAKIVMHCGGKYGDKKRALKLFADRCERLPERTMNRIVIENDEKTCNAEDVYELYINIGIPCVFDVFHHEVLPAFYGWTLKQIIERFRNTWGEMRQKIHYSNQDPLKQKGAHSKTVDVHRFAEFYKQIKDLELDIMLEVKDKQSSVMKLRKVFPELE